MKFKEFAIEGIEEFYEAMVWGRGKTTPRHGTVKMKYRCPAGPRKSRQVKHPSDCYKQYDVAQAQRMKTTRARTGPQQARRQSRTKNINTATKLVRRLNKYR
jgi:hypothetical protein